MPQPGLGLELECRGIVLKNSREKATGAGPEERERIRGKELLVGDELTKRGNFADSWTLTAELGGSPDLSLLCAEIVVHGPDDKRRRGVGQGIKLTPHNTGIAGNVALELLGFLKAWATNARPVPIAGFEDYGQWDVTLGAIDHKFWGQQVTAPIPLASLYDMLPVPGDDDMLPKTHKFVKAGSLVRLTTADLPGGRAPDGMATKEVNALLAYLSLIVSYVREGPRDTVAKGLKHVIPIMPRTDFAAMARCCAQGLDAYGGKIGGLVTEICANREIDLAHAMLHWKDARGIQRLPASEWVNALPEHDLVAEFDKMYRHGQIGGLGATMESLIYDPGVVAPVFEFRDIGSCATVTLPAFMEDVENEIRRIHKDALAK